MINLRDLPDDLEKYVALNALHDRNEALFFRVVCDNIDEIQPLIYTPTVGLACQRFGQIFQRPRGMFISANDRGRIARGPGATGRIRRSLSSSPTASASSASAISARNGMGIPVGKLSLYTACAGIRPEHCLPVMLDVGTNNAELLDDRFYIGLRQRRLSGAAYDEFVDEFMTAAREAFPGRADPVRGFRQSQRVPAAAQISGRACTSSTTTSRARPRWRSRGCSRRCA